LNQPLTASKGVRRDGCKRVTQLNQAAKQRPQHPPDAQLQSCRVGSEPHGNRTAKWLATWPAYKQHMPSSLSSIYPESPVGNTRTGAAASHGHTQQPTAAYKCVLQVLEHCSGQTDMTTPTTCKSASLAICHVAELCQEGHSLMCCNLCETDHLC
jgi:hypothetical protein